MPSVAVHEPQSLYGLIGIGCKTQLHQIRQAKSQGVGEETRGFIKVGRGQHHVSKTLIAGDKPETPEGEFSTLKSETTPQ